jgi:hypothetical protein
MQHQGNTQRIYANEPTASVCHRREAVIIECDLNCGEAWRGRSMADWERAAQWRAEPFAASSSSAQQ